MGRFNKTLQSFPRTFWVANTMELFERWAYYGLFIILSIYFVKPVSVGGLEFSHSEKAALMAILGTTVYLLPFITGAIADHFGYKRVLFISYIMLAIGFYFLGQLNSFWPIAVIMVFIALGASLFKPIISATIAKTTNNSNSSIGFGIFYMIVNLGALIGQYTASKFRQLDWDYAFIASSVVITINIFLLLFYKEPAREKSNMLLKEALTKVFNNIKIVFQNARFILFLLIISGFWAMYMQLFYSMPNFIDQWIDTRGIYNFLHQISPGLANELGTEEGIIAPERMLTLDTLYIVIFQVMISTFVMKYKPLKTMISGILIASIGIAFWFVTQNGAYLFISILIFAVGEMASSPKITEYLGRIAPKDKVALYMGMSYLPLALGNFFAGILAGKPYEILSDKTYLLKQEIATRGLDISTELPADKLFDKAAQMMDFSSHELTQYLWQQYNPSKIWLLYTGIGLFTTLCLFLYDKYILTEKMDAQGRKN